MLRIPVQPTFKGKFVPFFCPRTCASYVNDDDILQPVADDVGGAPPPRRSAKKNNSKRSTILQHLLAEPHQQMLQNSSALEIKGVAVRRGCERMTDHCRNADAISKLQPGIHCIWEGG